MSKQVPPPPDPPAPPPAAPPPPPPSAAPPSGSDADGNRTVMIILAYLGILALIPFVVEQRDQEVRWHAKHGLVLFGAEVILGILLLILDLAATAVFPPLGCVFAVLFLLLGLGITIFHIACMVKGVKGERLTVPRLSELADRF